jgi:hypothetical protein
MLMPPFSLDNISTTLTGRRVSYSVYSNDRAQPVAKNAVSS